MLRFSDRLLQAYALKEAFYDFMAAPSRDEADRRLDFWLEACDRLNLLEFKPCRKMRFYNKSRGADSKKGDKVNPLR